MSTEWTTVVDSRKLKREARRLERKKWESILQVCPHVVVPERAKRLQQRLNIDNLKERLLSEEWIEYQKQGWKYLNPLKPQRPNHSLITKDNETTEYSTLNLDNGWGDRVLFYRTK